MRKFVLMMLLAMVTQNVLAEDTPDSDTLSPAEKSTKSLQKNGWTLIGETDEFRVFAKRSSSRKNKTVVKMWFIFDYKKSRKTNTDEKEFLSEKIQSEFDCENEQTRDLYLLIYSDNGGFGQEVDNASFARPQWIPVVPDTIGESMWQAACSKK